MKNFDADLCLLQETRSLGSDYKLRKDQWGGNLWMAHGNHHAAGTLDLKQKFNGNIIYTETDPAGRFLTLFTHNKSVFLIGNFGCNNVKENIRRFETLKFCIFQEVISRSV